MPMQICSLCFGRCENWESFRSRCQNNDGVLRAAFLSKPTFEENEQDEVDVGQYNNTARDEQWFEDSQAAEDISILDCDLKKPNKEEEEEQQEQKPISGLEVTVAPRDNAKDADEHNDDEPGPSKPVNEQMVSVPQ